MKHRKLLQAAVYLSVALFFLVGCGFSATSVQPPATPGAPSETQVTIRPPTDTPIPATSTPQPTVLPTATEVNWSSLPPLIDVVLTEADIFPISSYAYISGTYFRDYFLERRNITSELEGNCQLDCAKVVVDFVGERLTITLMRAESAENAQKAISQLHDVLLNGSAYEHPLEDFYTGGLPPNSWLIARTNSEVVLGTSRGPVTVLVVWAYDLFALGICKETDEGTWCEGDLSGLAFESIAFADTQINRLTEAGYPP